MTQHIVLSVDPITQWLGEWAGDLNTASIFFRICFVIFLSAIVGCERSSKRHSAGLRTFILISLASCIAMMLDLHLGRESRTYILTGAVVIGASTISVNSLLYSSKNQIKGLTTSVALWTCSIIGLCVGAGMYSVAILSFVGLIMSLSLLPAFEVYLKNRSNHFEIHLELINSSYLQEFVTTIRKLGLKIDEIELNSAYVNSGLSVYSIAVSINSKELKQYKTHYEIIEALKSLEYIYHIEEMK